MISGKYTNNSRINGVFYGKKFSQFNSKYITIYELLKEWKIYVKQPNFSSFFLRYITDIKNLNINKNLIISSNFDKKNVHIQKINIFRNFHQNWTFI